MSRKDFDNTVTTLPTVYPKNYDQNVEGFAYCIGEKLDQITLMVSIGNVSGVNPTLDIKIQESDDDENWTDIEGQSLDQKTENDSNSLTVKTFFGRKKLYVRVFATIGGSSPEFFFSVTMMTRTRIVPDIIVPANTLITKVIAFYHMEENPSNTISDQSFNENDASLSGSGQVDGVGGVIGNAINYPSSSNARHLGPFLNDISPSTGKSFSFFSDSVYSQFVIHSTMEFSATSFARFSVATNGNGWSMLVRTAGPNFNFANALGLIGGFVCVQGYYSFDDGKMAIRVNGGPWNETVLIGSELDSLTTERLAIGGRVDGNAANDGPLDLVGLFEGRLTDREFDKLYNSGNGLEYPF